MENNHTITQSSHVSAIAHSMEGTGYQTRQTSKGHVIVMVLTRSRGIDPAQSEHYSCCTVPIRTGNA